MMPNGWEKTTFGEHIDLLNGFAFKSALYSDDENDIKLLRGDNIEPNKLRWRDVKRWSKTEYESLEKYHLKENDFIIAMDRTWITAGLKVAEVKQEDLPCLLVQRVSRIRSLPTLCQDLIKHHFSSYQFEQYVKSVQTETAVPHISATQIREFGLLLPPLPEQQKIAKILSTWDKAISTTERLIDNSNQQKKALMQQLLTGKKRLLDESGKRFEGEFNQHRLSELVNIDKKSLGKNTPENYEFEYISLSDVSTGTISKSLERHIFSSAPSRARRIVRENDLLLATVRPNLKGFAKARKEHDGFVASTGFAVLSAKKDVSSDYVYHYLFSHHLTGQINALVVGSNYPAINSSDVGSLKILCPPLEEQQKIATVLTNADREIELLEQQLADLQQEKKALMQVLLTGKKRVVVDGEIA